MKRYLLISLPFLLLSCSGTRSLQYSRAHFNKSLADSMLLKALDYEGLYSLLDTIKPISSVKYLTYPIAKDSSNGVMEHQIAVNQVYLDSIALFQRICDELSNSKVRFVLVPFQLPHKGKRNMEIYAVNLQKFRSKIREYASFFGQFGITPDTEPSQVITQIEYEKKYDRWRGYGYLFGYPAYAVDFFVSAGQQQDSTGEFVKRDFFQIPVFASQEGHFTYAMPMEHQPSNADTLLYQQSMEVLSRYQNLRKKYTNKNGIKAIKLWKKNLK